MIWYSDGFSSVLDRVPDGFHRVLGLVLNMMRNKTESLTLVCVSNNRQEIEDLLAAERVEPYSDVGPGAFGDYDQTFYKVYRRGGPLEWYNPPGGIYDLTGIAEFRRDGWRRVS
jgi:hypothetical protein